MEFYVIDCRELDVGIWKGVDGYWLIFFLCGLDAFVRLVEVSFEGIR